VAEIDVRTERVADVPLLIRQQQQMGIVDVLNEVITPHGNRKGLSVGALAVTWMSFILSERDHRMERVQLWADDQIQMLGAVLGEPVTAKDFTDDRLADLVRTLGDDAVWNEVETELGRRMIRVYSLRGEAVRVDSTTASLYHEPDEKTLFRKGHSKDHRPDLAQVKVMLASLDPLGMPIATLVVAGNHADDGLYVPAIERAREVVGQGGQLYIGDSKMAALETRAQLAQAEDFYLTPDGYTSRRTDRLLELLEPVWSRRQRLEPVRAPRLATDQGSAQATAPDLLAVGYETGVSRQTTLETRAVRWEERVLVVFSPSLARTRRRTLEERLRVAEKAILALTPPRAPGRRQYECREALEAAARAIFTKHRVEGLLSLVADEEIEQRAVGKYRGREARIEHRVRLRAAAERNADAIALARRLLGWRLYLTNAPAQRLPFADAVRAYRGASLIERNFSRLKGRPLGLRPIYVKREDHAKGLIRLLTLGLRVLAGMEFTAREALARTKGALSGVYPGNPKRTTSRPTTERMLEAFSTVTLTIVVMGGQTFRHITSLSPVQQRILSLMALPASLYEGIVSALLPIPP
jgi:transposase